MYIFQKSFRTFIFLGMVGEGGIEPACNQLTFRPGISRRVYSPLVVTVGFEPTLCKSTHGISVVTKPFIHVTVCPDRGTRTPNLVDISHLRQPLRHIGKIAEGAGFEPTGHERDHSFPGCPNRPLWQPSLYFFENFFFHILFIVPRNSYNFPSLFYQKFIFF